MFFTPGVKQERSGRANGWLSDNSRTGEIRVEPLLWAGSALAALASAGAVTAAPWSETTFRESVRYVEESSLDYHNNVRGGWWRFPGNPDIDAYPTTLATEMLMDFRDGNVPWPGGERSDSLIKNNLEWLLSAYQTSEQTMPGWKTGAATKNVPGLTLQAYAVLLRAQAHGDKRIPPGILNIVNKFVKGGFQDSVLEDMNVPLRDVSFQSTEFLWYPWALECTARWLDLQPDRAAALRDPLVRRTLTNLLLTESRKYLKDDPFVFRYAELLYSLGSLSRSLANVEEK